MNKFLVSILILLAAIIGFLAAWIGFDVLKKKEDSQVYIDILNSAVIQTIMVEGKLKSKSSNSIILEKEGQRLEIFVDEGTIFAKLDGGDITKKPLANLTIDKLELNSVIEAVVIKDKISPKVKLVGQQFWIK